LNDINTLNNGISDLLNSLFGIRLLSINGADAIEKEVYRLKSIFEDRGDWSESQEKRFNLLLMKCQELKEMEQMSSSKKRYKDAA